MNNWRTAGRTPVFGWIQFDRARFCAEDGFMEQLSLSQQFTFETVDTSEVLKEAEDSQVAAANVTEIILPPSQIENFQLLLPMLTQLNQECRWLAWIDPPREMLNRWQQTHGIVTSEILVLRSSEQHSALDLAARALAAGTCHAVVLWTGRIRRSDFARLETASQQGRSHGVVLRTR